MACETQEKRPGDQEEERCTIYARRHHHGDEHGLCGHAEVFSTGVGMEIGRIPVVEPLMAKCPDHYSAGRSSGVYRELRSVFFYGKEVWGSRVSAGMSLAQHSCQ